MFLRRLINYVSDVPSEDGGKEATVLLLTDVFNFSLTLSSGNHNEWDSLVTQIECPDEDNEWYSQPVATKQTKNNLPDYCVRRYQSLETEK